MNIILFAIVILKVSLNDKEYLVNKVAFAAILSNTNIQLI